MEQGKTGQPEERVPEGLRTAIREAIQEFVSSEQTKTEPALKAELNEERRRREQLERAVHELSEENRRARERAEETERHTAIRGELQRLGVAKVDLAFRAVKDDIVRAEDGRLVAKSTQGDVGMKDFLSEFVNENPELMPARIAGGTGALAQRPGSSPPPPFDLERIRPGMSAEEREAARREISRAAALSLKGQ